MTANDEVMKIHVLFDDVGYEIAQFDFESDDPLRRKFRELREAVNGQVPGLREMDYDDND